MGPDDPGAVYGCRGAGGRPSGRPGGTAPGLARLPPSLCRKRGALLGSLPAITGSRALLGLAAGGVGTAATTMIVDYYGDGIGDLVASRVRGRLMGGLSTLRNLGRFASPLLTRPGLVGVGAAAPFVAGAWLAGLLAAALLGWTVLSWTPGTAREGSPSAPVESRSVEPASCQ